MKIRRTKKKVILKTNAILAIVFVLTFASYIISSIFLRQYNVSLSQKIQKINNEIASYQTVNASLSLDVQQLSAYDRVMSIATASDLMMFDDNIVTIVTTE